MASRSREEKVVVLEVESKERVKGEMGMVVAWIVGSSSRSKSLIIFVLQIEMFM